MKGPVALVVPALVLLPIAWRERRRLRLDLRGICRGRPDAAVVGLPWYVAMWIEHGNAYLQSFFVGDNLERFATERFNEARPFWFYLPVLLGGLMPWSVYLVAFVRRRAAPARGSERFVSTDTDWRLLIWAAMPVLFFTLSVGKQPRYILPVLPPLAVLVARGIIERIETARNHRWSLGAATWVTAAMYIALALVFVRMEPLLINAYPLATWVGVCLLGCSAIALAGIAATSSWRHLPIVAGVAGVVMLVAVVRRARRRPPGAGRANGRTDSHQPLRPGADRRLQCVLAEPWLLYGPPRMELFDVEQAGHFLHSPERVLLVLRSADLPAVAAASGLTLKTLGEVRYLNTANIRLRTLLRPDPTTEIEMISLVTNR